MSGDIALQIDLFIRMLIAAVLGAAVGFEREARDQPAGIRTHMLVSVGSATFTVFTIPTAQSLLDRIGKYDTISVAAKEGVTQQALAEEINPILPPTAQVRTADAQAKEDAQDVSFTKFIRYFLLSFAGVALFVGAFVIFNILSITVAQRVREFATIRTIGGSRRQILWSVVLEAFVSFLNFGIKETEVSWGNVLANAQAALILGNWWWAFFPGMAIALTVIAINFIGDGLRDALDPRSRE